MQKLFSLLFSKKMPLLLMVIGQAAMLYQWQMHSFAGSAFITVNAAFLISILTAIALDFAITQIAFAKKSHWLHWAISIVTSLMFCGIGVAIAVVQTGDILHAAFSIGIFLYSWFISIVLNAEHDKPNNTVAPVLQYARDVQYPEPVQVEEDYLLAELVTNAIADAPKLDALPYTAPVTNAEQAIAPMQCNAEQTNAVVHHCPKCNAEVNPNSWYRVQKRGSCAKCK